MGPLLPVYSRCNLSFNKGSGCFLYDKNDKKYIDLAAGIAVNSLGYAHPKLVAALKEASEKPWHLSNLYQIDGQTTLATKLTKASGLGYVFFCNSGTEAVETSIKIIRRYFHTQGKPQKKNIITISGAFHGRSITAITAAGNPKYQEGYAPLLEGFINLNRDNITIEKIANAINDDVAAILLEPIQGEGGIYDFPLDFLQKLRTLTKENNILLAFDEVQCGIGRTGKLFHHQWANILPDLIASAKGIGGGFPLAACLVKEDIGSVMTKGSHGGTYGGNPLAMAVGNTVIDEILQDGFLDDVTEKGTFLKNELESLQKKYPNVIDTIRGTGLMLGIKVKKDCANFIDLLRTNGILTVMAADNIARILPPLIITKKEIKDALQLIEKTIIEFEKNDN